MSDAEAKWGWLWEALECLPRSTDRGCDQARIDNAHGVQETCSTGCDNQIPGGCMPADDKPETREAVDFAALERLIKLVAENAKELEWLLDQQSQLRTEYLTFYKKDLKEIFAGLKEIIPEEQGGAQGALLKQTLDRIVQDHRQDLERSYRFIDGTYQQLARLHDE
ncbi:MAG: hypothetical protein H6708_27835 [Kofleriaceae bacterium]|nr:hypothetical protein [Myxococcales bacterium]MCB9564220.1 hypothetical protein [Kofleriaceae bacterium]